jgi:hypothetical protein
MYRRLTLAYKIMEELPVIRAKSSRKTRTTRLFRENGERPRLSLDFPNLRIENFPGV